MLTLAAAAVALAGAAAAPAQPGIPYDVTLSAKRIVSWDIPRRVVYTDCTGSDYLGEKGDETWEVRTRGAQRVRIWVSGRDVTFIYPAAADGTLAPGLVAGGHRRRSYRRDAGHTGGGDCGGETVHQGPPRTDCGQRLPSAVTPFAIVGRKLGWDLVEDSAAGQGKTGYDTCTLHAPKGMSTTSWTDILGRLPAGRFAEGRRKIVVRAARTFPAETIDVERSGRLTTSGSVEWMATFRRAPGAK